MKSHRNTRSRYLRKTTDYYINKYTKPALIKRGKAARIDRTPKSKQAMADDEYEEPRHTNIMPSLLNTPIQTPGGTSRRDRSKLSNGSYASRISNVSRSRSRSRSTSIQKVNNLKAMHVRSQKSINQVYEKENIPINDTESQNIKNDNDNKSTCSISEFYADQEFIEFLKNVSIYCTAEDEPKGLTQYRRLYKNLECLRDKFQTYKRNKSMIRTEYDDQQSDDCSSVQPTFEAYEGKLNQINIDQFSTLNSNNTQKPTLVPKIVPARTSSRSDSRQFKPVKTKPISKSRIPRLKSVSKPVKSVTKLPKNTKSSKSRQASIKLTPNMRSDAGRNSKRTQQITHEYDNFEIPAIEKHSDNEESLELDSAWSYSSPNFK